MPVQSRSWCWLWITLAFFLGIVLGAVGLFVLLAVLQAMIS
jgi:hypothetical protein